jgi:hypothetical protein
MCCLSTHFLVATIKLCTRTSLFVIDRFFSGIVIRKSPYKSKKNIVPDSCNNFFTAYFEKMIAELSLPRFSTIY